MDSLDIVALMGLGWVFDKVQDRCGLAMAWIVTTALAVTILAAIVAVLIAVL